MDFEIYFLVHKWLNCRKIWRKSKSISLAFSFSFKRRKSERQRKSNCKAELEGIKLEFADDDKDLVLLPAMEGDALEEVFPDLDGEWGVNPNKKTILSTRINQFPDEYVYRWMCSVIESQWVRIKKFLKIQRYNSKAGMILQVYCIIWWRRNCSSRKEGKERWRRMRKIWKGEGLHFQTWGQRWWHIRMPTCHWWYERRSRRRVFFNCLNY